MGWSHPSVPTCRRTDEPWVAPANGSISIEDPGSDDSPRNNFFRTDMVELTGCVADSSRIGHTVCALCQRFITNEDSMVNVRWGTLSCVVQPKWVAGTKVYAFHPYCSIECVH